MDTSRTTPAAGDGFPGLPQRSIETWIWYRAAENDSGERTEFGRLGAAVDLSSGPYPLIVTCHGNNGHPTTHFPLVAQLVAEGYVVAGPVFPLTNRDGPGLPASLIDLPNQPGDVSFVIDQLLALSAGPGPLGGTIDPEAIALQGHSLGGFTTAAVAHHSCCQDPRVGASVLLASGLVGILPGDFFTGTDVPLFVVHGDADTTLPLAVGQQAFTAAPPPKYFLTVVGGTHDSFLRYPGPQADGTARALAAFYDAHLGLTDTALSPTLDALNQRELFNVAAESPLCDCARPWCTCP